MSSQPSKVSGTFNNAKGAVRQTAGKVVGSDEMQAKGAAEKAEGQAETQAAKTKGHAEGTGSSVKGSVKDTVGGVIGNEKMQAEGKADKGYGDAKKAANS
ncbi:hypothetical protein DSO57_1031452 [Entomophthora muscae]|uniref:Uncharacterized protein n=2 Tax=Entomophthora muscae TaxID=34485 RepID=A0ACC2STC7_9FUNG|nr:hypothetical protein DSO57_1017401 [Entomophthora muscae]KAJ9087609.1 hypothetical protein DSO57_1031452 [Entomophthora muscae]